MSIRRNESLAEQVEADRERRLLVDDMNDYAASEVSLALYEVIRDALRYMDSGSRANVIGWLREDGFLTEEA